MQSGPKIGDLDYGPSQHAVFWAHGIFLK